MFGRSRDMVGVVRENAHVPGQAGPVQPILANGVGRFVGVATICTQALPVRKEESANEAGIRRLR